MNDDTTPNTPDLISDDDDEKLVPALATSADNQIIWLGVAVAVVMLFGSAIWGWFFGDADAPAHVARRRSAILKTTVAGRSSSPSKIRRWRATRTQVCVAVLTADECS